MKPKFRILSLSGGGVRGLYTASLLARIQFLTGKRLHEHFDLIVGTSTSGMLALAVGLNQSLDAVRDFYANNGSLIFAPAGRRRRNGPTLLAPHENTALREAVQQLLGQDRCLGDSGRPLVITSFHATSGRPVCFKTRHHPDLINDHTMKAWEVALTSSLTPVIYRALDANGAMDYVDGGVWATCPVLIGAIEAIHRFNRQRDDIDILSIGTTRAPFRMNGVPSANGVRRSNSQQQRTLVDMLLEANRCSSLLMARYLTGSDSILEVDRVLQGEGIELDDASPAALRALQAFGERDANTHAHTVQLRFLSSLAPKWTPCS